MPMPGLEIDVAILNYGIPNAWNAEYQRRGAGTNTIFFQPLFIAIASMLVALLTVTPETFTGRNLATGVITPVRPT